MDKFERLVDLDKKRTDCKHRVDEIVRQHKSNTKETAQKLMNDKAFIAAGKELALLESEYLRAVSELSLNEIMAMGNEYGD